MTWLLLWVAVVKGLRRNRTPSIQLKPQAACVQLFVVFVEHWYFLSLLVLPSPGGCGVSVTMEKSGIEILSACAARTAFFHWLGGLYLHIFCIIHTSRWWRFLILVVFWFFYFILSSSFLCSFLKLWNLGNFYKLNNYCNVSIMWLMLFFHRFIIVLE